MSKIKLGDSVKEKITGFAGIAVAKTSWLSGCVRFSVRRKNLKLMEK